MGSMGGGVGRIYVDHDVLYIGELLFHAGMDLFGHIVSFPQGFVAIDLDFQIHIDFIAKHPGVKQIDALDAVLRRDKILSSFLRNRPHKTYPVVSRRRLSKYRTTL